MKRFIAAVACTVVLANCAVLKSSVVPSAVDCAKVEVTDVLFGQVLQILMSPTWASALAALEKDLGDVVTCTVTKVLGTLHIGMAEGKELTASGELIKARAEAWLEYKAALDARK